MIGVNLHKIMEQKYVFCDECGLPTNEEKAVYADETGKFYCCFKHLKFHDPQRKIRDKTVILPSLTTNSPCCK